jgi:hypothetical protein
MFKIKSFLLITVVVLLMGCSPSPDINQLEGYWQIQKVVFPDGEVKEYPLSLQMDYFDIQDSTGTKFRVNYKNTNTYVNNGSPVNFTWSHSDGELVLTFEEESRSYQQVVEELGSEALILEHEDGKEYYYTKHQPDEQKG